MKITAKLAGDSKEIAKHIREEVPVVIDEDAMTVTMTDDNPQGTVGAADVLELAQRLVEDGIIE